MGDILLQYVALCQALFIGHDVRMYEYILTLIVDDLDNFYRPGQWHLKNESSIYLLEEVEKNLERP